MGITRMDPGDAFTTPIGDKEVMRIIVTEHGKKVISQGTMATMALIVVGSYAMNHYQKSVARLNANSQVVKETPVVPPAPGKPGEAAS